MLLCTIEKICAQHTDAIVLLEVIVNLHIHYDIFLRDGRKSVWRKNEFFFKYLHKNELKKHYMVKLSL